MHISLLSNLHRVTSRNYLFRILYSLKIQSIALGRSHQTPVLRQFTGLSIRAWSLHECCVVVLFSNDVLSTDQLIMRPERSEHFMLIYHFGRGIKLFSRVLSNDVLEVSCTLNFGVCFTCRALGWSYTKNGAWGALIGWPIRFVIHGLNLVVRCMVLENFVADDLWARIIICQSVSVILLLDKLSNRVMI